MVDLSEVFPRVCHSMVSYPWSKSVFVKRSGQFETEERANFADAPALSAVMVLTGLSPASGMGRLMRKARSQDPTWFDEALQLAQLIAFGCMTNSIARDYTDA